MKPKVLVIVGPTSSGKSDLAVKLAKRLNGEIVSADSKQVYKGLNIGTGKITKKEMHGVKHHLLDVVDPKRQFTAEKYRRLATKAVTGILRRDKLPIIAGGTGFYIDALLNDVPLPAVKPDKKLRARLSKKSLNELLAMLKRLDHKRWTVINANPSDKKNARRIIRAIEIATNGRKVEGRRFSSARPMAMVSSERAPTPPLREKYDISIIGLQIPPAKLKKKIHARLIKRLRQGMLAEASRLHKNGLSWKRMDELGLEYRYMARYLQGKMTKAEMIEKLNTAIWHYAKRQMTWFKRKKAIRWIRKPAEALAAAGYR